MLLAEGVADKFQRYVRVDTQSSEQSKSVPSTPGQLVLAGMLREELLALGLADVRLDPSGLVQATLPGNKPGAPVIGFLAHLDTFPGVPGRGVRPILHRNYDGREIVLAGGCRLSPANTLVLACLFGHDLITSDGTTLLGADDKAGVAEIMTLIGRLLAAPDLPHGPLRIAFTPDEEVGRGTEHFDVAGFGAACAYTVDGGEAGGFEAENFNAVNLKVTIHGVSSHTGTARCRMINAVAAAGELATGVPAGMRPETTDGHQGFLHPDGIEGNAERVTMRWLIRDFTEEGLAAKRRLFRLAQRHLEAKYPGLRIVNRVTARYHNMAAKLAEDPRISAHALEAIGRAGLDPIRQSIRGGTDGARLTYMGLPTPNLFTGGMNVHSRREFVSVQWMEKAVEVLQHLTALWADERI